jgi:hypothetical protein
MEESADVGIEFWNTTALKLPAHDIIITLGDFERPTGYV